MVVIPHPGTHIYGKAAGFGRHWTEKEWARWRAGEAAARREAEPRPSVIDQPAGALTVAPARIPTPTAPAVAIARPAPTVGVGIAAVPGIVAPREPSPYELEVTGPAQALRAKRFMAEFERKRTESEIKIEEQKRARYSYGMEKYEEQLFKAAAIRKRRKKEDLTKEQKRKLSIARTKLLGKALIYKAVSPVIAGAHLGTVVPKKRIKTERGWDLTYEQYLNLSKQTPFRKWTVKAKPGELERYKTEYKETTGFDIKEARQLTARAGATVGGLVTMVAVGPAIAGAVVGAATPYVGATAATLIPTAVIGGTIMGGTAIEAAKKGLPMQEALTVGAGEWAAWETAFRAPKLSPIKYRPLEVGVTKPGKAPVKPGLPEVPETETIYRGLALFERPIVGVIGKKVKFGVPEIKPKMEAMRAIGLEPTIRPEHMAEVRMVKKMTKEVMPEWKPSEEVIQKWIKTKRKKPSPYEEPLPEAVKAMGIPRTKKAFELIGKEKAVVFGMTATGLQVPKAAIVKARGIPKGEPYTTDIDVMVKRTVAGTTKVAGRWETTLQPLGKRPMRRTEMLIETKPAKDPWMHAEDIKSMFDPGMIKTHEWGYPTQQPFIKRKDIGFEYTKLGEEMHRKIGSVFTLRPTGKRGRWTYAPEEQRMKDVADMILQMKTLTKGFKPKARAKAMEDIKILERQFSKGLRAAKKMPIVKEPPRKYPSRRYAPVVSVPSYKPPAYKPPSYKPPSKPPSYKPSYKPPSKPPSYKPSIKPPSYKPPSYKPPSYKPPSYKPSYRKYLGYKEPKYPPYIPIPYMPTFAAREYKPPKGVGVRIMKGYTASLLGIMVAARTGKFLKEIPKAPAKGFGIRAPLDPQVILKKLKGRKRVL